MKTRTGDFGLPAAARIGALPVLGAWSSTAAASDYTPLYFLFLELPVFVFACVFFGLSFVAPRVGAVLCGLLFAGTFALVILWSHDELPFLSFTLLIDLAGVAVAIVRISKRGQKENAPSAATDEEA